MKLKEYQNLIERKLGEAGVQCPGNEAEQLLLAASGKDRLWFYTSQREETDAETAEKAESLLGQRLTGRPLQYVLAGASFMGLEFYVDERVLIPRQDTELLAESAIDWLRARGKGAEEYHPAVLDLCTGSGALAVSIKHEIPSAYVTAVDISWEALDVAMRNAMQNGCSVTFVLSDLFENAQRKFDLIVTNPPYICSEEIDGLQTEVKDHEPSLALDGGADGLDIIRRIIDEAPERLVSGGLLLMEIGDAQGGAVFELARRSGMFTGISVEKDLNGHDRMLRCTRV